MNAAELIREDVRSFIQPPPSDLALTQGMKGAITGALNLALTDGGATPDLVNARRHMVLGYLFGGPLGVSAFAISSKSLSDRQWYALYQWVGFWNDPAEGGWQHRPEFPVECGLVLAQILEDDRARMEAFLGADA